MSDITLRVNTTTGSIELSVEADRYRMLGADIGVETDRANLIAQLLFLRAKELLPTPTPTLQQLHITRLNTK